MFHRQPSWVLGVCILSLPPCGLAFGQLPGRGSIGGAPLGTGVGGKATPRSGLGVSNNPVVNPAPSLTLGQVLNPRGSLNTGQVLNPAPSLRRPLAGVTTPEANDGRGSANNGTGATKDSPTQTSSEQGNPDTSVLTQATTGRQNGQPIGAQLLESVVALDEKITEVAPDAGWSDRLSLDMLRSVPVSSEGPSDDAGRQRLNKILNTYQAIAKDEKNAEIAALTEFKRTMALMQEYLTPPDARRLRELRLAFVELHDQLGKYKNGASWSQYLSLPNSLKSASGPQDSAIAAQMTKLLDRFDKLAGDRTYQKVTSLPGFDPAYAALKAVATTKSAEAADTE